MTQDQLEEEEKKLASGADATAVLKRKRDDLGEDEVRMPAFVGLFACNFYNVSGSN